ncbi:MAG: DUF2283 domain-containing protein [Desulfurococcales archaeon]|nr:DUF2283 domain-containing protein [Desulfurococcales archaeon]
MEIRVSYDRIADALYVKLRDDKIADSDEVAPGVIIDFNDKGEVVGIEVLEFSRRNVDLKKLVMEGPEALVANA